MVVPEEAGGGDRSPSPDYLSPMDEHEGAGSQTPEQEDQEQEHEEPEFKLPEVNENNGVTQVSARRWGPDSTRRKSRSLECAATAHPGNRSRRQSQVDPCGCWD